MVNAENKAKNPPVQPRVKNAVKGWIKKLHIDDFKLTALEIQGKLRREPNLKGMRIPSVRTIQKIIHDWEHPKTEEEKESKERFRELERPWDLETLVKHPLPTETLPTVLLVWSMSQVPPDEPLTIREAMWVSRLCSLVGNLDFLYVYAKWYAAGERWPEIAGVPHESVSSFSDRYTQRQAIQKALPYDLFRGSVSTLEEIAKSVFWKAPKGNEVFTDKAMKEGVAEWTARLAINAKAAQMPVRFSQIQQWVKKTLEQQLSEIPQSIRETFPSPEPSLQNKMNELNDRMQALLKGQQKGGKAK